MISMKLNEFGMDLESDIVAITTDGCAMMRKVGRIIQPFQQLYYAHGLQLVIQDVFYSKFHNTGELSYYSSANETDEEGDLEIADEDDEIDGLIVLGDVAQENTNCLRFDILELANKIRKIVKIFKRSPLKNDLLQRYVKEIYPTGLNLILDCKTRWSSLLNMFERIVKIKLPVQKALLDLQEVINLSDHEITEISKIIHSLGPIKAALEALCRRDVNLITAEATIKFLLDELLSSHSSLNEAIQKAINQRMVQERYTEASVILQCLHNPRAQLEKRCLITTFCNDLLSSLMRKAEDGEKLLEENEVNVSNSQSSDPGDLPVAKKLQLAIDASLRIPSQQITNPKKSLSSILKYEITIAEQSGERAFFGNDLPNATYSSSNLCRGRTCIFLLCIPMQ